MTAVRLDHLFRQAHELAEVEVLNDHQLALFRRIRPHADSLIRRMKDEN